MTDSRIIRPDQADAYDADQAAKRKDLEQRIERLNRRSEIVDAAEESLIESKQVVEDVVASMNRKQRRTFKSKRKRLRRK